MPRLIVAALARRGITEPFAIQAATIADALDGRDLCGKAPTGSGKTLAFGIPMVARVTRSAPKKPHGLVLAPTRELAIQVADELRALGTELRVLAVYGGAGIEPQIKKLRAGVDIVVATPGRLKDLIDRRVCDLRAVTFVVLDEADRMADMGFLPEVKRILDLVPADRQTVLFSATLDGAIDELVSRYQVDPVVHEMADEPAGEVTHRFWVAERPGRVALVADIVDRLGHTVVFCRTKHGSDRVARQLGKAGVAAAAIHGNRSQSQRERALEAFHRGDVQALVATDVAARGIHVEGVRGVVHFDLPGDPKDYIHRSGRTGRAGSPGTVVALFDAAQRKDAVKLKRAAGVDAEIEEPDVASLPEAPQRAFAPERARAPRRDPRPATAGADRSRPAPGGADRRSAKAGDHRPRSAKAGDDRPRSAKAGGDQSRSAKGGAPRDRSARSGGPAARSAGRPPTEARPRTGSSDAAAAGPPREPAGKAERAAAKRAPRASTGCRRARPAAPRCASGASPTQGQARRSWPPASRLRAKKKRSGKPRPGRLPAEVASGGRPATERVALARRSV
ncbi:MAG: DEAD/DEAH box helicase [Acidimicrobiales bacterium]